MEKILDSIDLNELSAKLGGEPRGENVKLTGVAGINDVEAGQITWAENEKALKDTMNTKAAAVIVPSKLFEQIKDSIRIPCIVIRNPRAAYARTLSLFFKKRLPDRTIAQTAVIGKNVVIGKDVYIGDYAFIGDNTVIDDGVSIYPHTYIGRHVEIGKNSILYPFAVIYSRCKVGSRTVIHSGTVIGADGFGFVEDEGQRIKIPQVGYVEIGDDVEIGANVTIDRATTGVTRIGSGSKIDNLVQIGHNCKLGKNCIMVSQSGMAGSCDLGDNVTVAAQAGLAPHISIGKNTIVAGRSGVNHDIPENTIVSGFPAKPHHEALKIQAATQRIPHTMKQVKDLEKRIEALEAKLAEKERT